MVVKKTDVLIIGAGPAGISAAWSLSKSSYKITCFEQGSKVSTKDYRSTHPNWEELVSKKFNPNPNVRCARGDYPIDDKNSPISIANFNGVGGSSVLYSGHVPRFYKSDFKTKTKDKVGYDWPIDLKDLEKFYDLNEKKLGVRGLIGNKNYPNIKKLKPHIPLGRLGEKVAEGFNKLGWNWWPSYSAVNIKKTKTKDKFSINDICNSYLKEALKNGVKLYQNHKVLKIIVKKNVVDGVIYLDNKNNKKFLKTSLIILACSALGTPRLLLNSSNKDFPNGLANSSGLVGKNLMLHPYGYVEGIVDEKINSQIGPKGCCIFSHQFYKTNIKNNFKRGYTIHLLRENGPLTTSRNLLKFRELKFGKKFHDIFMNTFGHLIPIAIICEDLPQKTNFLELDKKKKDLDGMPGIKINYKLNKNSKKMLSHGITKCKILLKTIGAKKIKSFGPVRETGWHISGTAKMGTSKKNSVVNKFGQSHDIKNLVITDSSIFPTCSGVNILSTIVALSLRISDDIKKNPNKYFNRSK